MLNGWVCYYTRLFANSVYERYDCYQSCLVYHRISGPNSVTYLYYIGHLHLSDVRLQKDTCLEEFGPRDQTC